MSTHSAGVGHLRSTRGRHRGVGRLTLIVAALGLAILTVPGLSS